MDYQRHYQRLIERARNRSLDGYVEVHHVLPRCMGGSDDPQNLVRLLPEEHFVAHQLLCKIHPHQKLLAYALVNMIGNPHGQRKNKLYGWIRRKHAKNVSEQMKSLWKDEVVRNKFLAAIHRNVNSDSFKAKISKIHKGRVKSPEEIARFVETKTGMKYKKMSAESRANMASARRKTWEERRANGTASLIAKKVWIKRRGQVGALAWG